MCINEPVDCSLCVTHKKERDEALEALTLQDGKASEIFSDYFGTKAKNRFLENQRDISRILSALLRRNLEYGLEPSDWIRMSQMKKELEKILAHT